MTAHDTISSEWLNLPAVAGRTLLPCFYICHLSILSNGNHFKIGRIPQGKGNTSSTDQKYFSTALQQGIVIT
jgi:hypothetical protein